MPAKEIFSTDGLLTISKYVAPETLFAFNLDCLVTPECVTNSDSQVTEPLRVILERLTMLGKVAVITNKSRNDALGILGFEPTLLLADSPEQPRGVLFAAAMKKEGVHRAVYFGENTVDNEVFALRGFDLLGIHVGEQLKTAATYYLNKHSALLGLLNSITGIMEVHGMAANDSDHE